MRLYDELTHGGDVTYAIEILPVSGLADPSWRYVLIEACGCLMNVLMVPRVGDVSAHLDAAHFTIYRDNATSPTLSIRVSSALAAEHASIRRAIVAK